MKIISYIVLFSFLFWGFNPLLHEIIHSENASIAALVQIHDHEVSSELVNCCAAEKDQNHIDHSLSEGAISDSGQMVNTCECCGEQGGESSDCCDSDCHKHHHCNCHLGAAVAFDISLSGSASAILPSIDFNTNYNYSYNFLLPDVIWHPPQIA
jgi:hypothetical protein